MELTNAFILSIIITIIVTLLYVITMPGLFIQIPGDLETIEFLSFRVKTTAILVHSAVFALATFVMSFAMSWIIIQL